MSNVPKGTKYLDFAVIDLDFTAANHGGGEVEYKGSGKIAENALDGYKGPCPPVEHRYEITVQALNDKKELVLGRGKAVRNWCCR
ncbi:MAG TPA: hypothetical protein DDZ83_05940 [Nitrospinae bacterium]|nr:hypothetical protein [Nitrospinota bacterium]